MFSQLPITADDLKCVWVIDESLGTCVNAGICYLI